MKTDRKEHKVYSSPGYVLFLYLICAFGALIMSLSILIDSKFDIKWWIPFLFAFPFIILWILCRFVFDKNAFVKVYISKEFIRNKYISIRWEDIKDYKINELYVTIGKDGHRKVLKPVIAFGDFEDKGFFKQNPKKCVMISASKKTYGLLKEYGAEKSETIQRLLNKNEFWGNRK